MDTSKSLKRNGHSSLERRREPKAVRAAAGRERRDVVPLDAHAELVVPDDRASALSILQAQDATRLQDLVPIRYGRMLATPFTFLRGSAAVMAADLAAGPRTDLTVQLCGDAHLSNFGMFSSPERRLVFDINDFDETLPGPFEWDVKRLAASVVVAGRNNQFDKKTNQQDCESGDGCLPTGDRDGRGDESARRVLLPDRGRGLAKSSPTAKSDRRRLAKTRKKSARKNSLGALGKLTDVVDGRRVIVSNPPLIVAMPDEQRRAEMTQIEAFFGEYRATLPADRGQLMDRYSMTDIARKVVGVGSVGTRCLIALFESGDGDPLFLQIKEAAPSVLEAHLAPSGFDQEGHRVVDGQRKIQATPDALVGWARYERADESTDFYVRQLWDGKASADVETMPADVLQRTRDVRRCPRARPRPVRRCGDDLRVRRRGRHLRPGGRPVRRGLRGSHRTGLRRTHRRRRRGSGSDRPRPLSRADRRRAGFDSGPHPQMTAAPD